MKEEVEETLRALREHLDAHDKCRVAVQDDLETTRSVLTERIERMRDELLAKLEEHTAKTTTEILTLITRTKKILANQEKEETAAKENVRKCVEAGLALLQGLELWTMAAVAPAMLLHVIEENNTEKTSSCTKPCLEVKASPRKPNANVLGLIEKGTTEATTVVLGVMLEELEKALDEEEEQRAATSSSIDEEANRLLDSVAEMTVSINSQLGGGTVQRREFQAARFGEQCQDVHRQHMRTHCSPRVLYKSP